MALRPYALCTLADLKAYKAKAGTGKDRELEQAINRASRLVQEHLDRRLVYWAPPETESSDNVVSSRTLQAETVPGGSISQPNSAGRTLLVSFVFTGTDRTAAKGIVTVTGTVAGVVGVTEAFDRESGDVVHGVKFFTAISGVVVTGVSGAGGTDTYKVGASAGYEEYHTLEPATCELRPLDWPIREVLLVNEDGARAYGGATQLTAVTDYEITRGGTTAGRVRRVSAKSPIAWYRDFRAVKLVYSAGYFGAANVPPDLKQVAMKLAALMYEEMTDRPLGISSYTDPSGNFTRLGPVGLTGEMKGELGPYERPDRFVRSGERDWDLEAA